MPLSSASSASRSARYNADIIIVEDLMKPEGPILTGLGFLDHMVDQLNSHAQIGVTLTIGNFAAADSIVVKEEQPDDETEENHYNRHAREQAKLMRLVGSKLGGEIRKLVNTAAASTSAIAQPDGCGGGSSCFLSSRFCCPLDEALVACQLRKKLSTTITSNNSTSTANDDAGCLLLYTLAPYGKFSRKYIGKLETAHLELFWQCLAVHSGLEISLNKIRGNNAHHIVEASFKAFSRALRNLLDGVDTATSSVTTASTSSPIPNRNNLLSQLYGPDSDNYKAGIALQRKGHIQRQTKETSISVTLQLDGGASGVHVSTGIATLDAFVTTLAQHAQCSLQLHCHGDLHIDEHHTAEDVAIALGQVINEALGTKAGLNRMWSCSASSCPVEVEVTMDLSNRPELKHNLFSSSRGSGGNNEGGDYDDTNEMAGDLSLEMMEHVLESLVVNARLTVHIVETRQHTESSAQEAKSCTHLDTIQAVAQAFGQAFFYCASVDLRRAGLTASSKGTLSV